ncbi:SGNH/GDSL hydrolase family protein [Acinetobacter baumannii]|uniref:SGNH/GDSL hydrolase family protein n=1 Tax=Acinetobacter baumannii TaxID=470 RepID=UPI000825B06F|nr:SGNH/GDSL hydrolase family protein [Acinetobacter baumannii]KAA8935213.1 SGNH/GDSL hydrolase family protein [Acinetobacter baumannii]KAA8942130.1 SGNH/GDSL hydrolase family protein [Acinetobacter baumannii]QBY13185.1 SGNH/GDSL hydrolase family protein [Acinetobacter baumannii]
MADEIITREELVDAKADAKDLGECVNGNETGIVTPRYGDPYPTLPAAIQKIESVGGLVSAPNLTALQAITPIYNHQLGLDESTGNLYRWNSLATPSPQWVATGRNYINDAKTYADQQDLVIDANAKRHVQIPKEVSQLLINKSPDITQPKFGDITTGGTASGVAIGTYILINPAATTTTIKRISILSSITSGDVEIRKYSKSGTTFTMLSSIATLHVSKVGINEFGVNDFLPFTVNAGEYLAATVKTAGAMALIGSSTNDVYYSNASIGTGPITGTTGKFNLKFAFFDTNGSERAQAFIDYLETVSNESEVNFDNILVDYAGNLGLSTTPSEKPNTNNGIGHMCIGKPVTGFGSVSQVEVYSASAGTAQIGVYSKSGQIFTRKRYKDITLSAGLNTILLDLAVGNGDYIGIRTSVIGQVEYENNTVGHDGMYLSTNNTNPNSFTSSTSSPLTAYAYQLRFTLALKMLSSEAALKPWIGKKYVSFGDSITWYNGRTFYPSHNEAGTIAKGYQSYIVDALGCTLDNQGESGWTMPGIFASRVNTYNFSDVYAVTITAGANDHKNSVPVGTVQSIGSAFNLSSYAGALQASIEKIINSNKDTKIFLITPIRGWYSQATADAITGEMQGVKLLSVRYADVMKEIGALYGLHVIDFYNEVGFNDLNKNTFLGDNAQTEAENYLLHPNNKGYQRMGELIVSKLKGF